MSLVATILHRLIGIALFVGVAGVGMFFTVAAPWADRRENRVLPDSVTQPDSASLALHAGLTIVDLHADPLLWPRRLEEEASHGQVDVPRLIEGKVALQVFSVVTKVPPGQNYESNPSDRDQLWLVAAASRWPVATWRDPMARALHQARKLDDAARRSRGRLLVVRSRDDLETYLRFRERGDTGRVAGLLALEGLHLLGGNLSRLDTLWQAGFRIAGLTHFFDNEVGGSSAGEAKVGLTDFGREVIRRMEELGMVVDLAHASPALIADVLAMARRPVIVSHTGVQATCEGPRNLSDESIRGIAANGGVIGIGYWDAAVCDISPAGIARAIRHVADLVGVQHVALGSDFDGAVTTAFDTSQLVKLTHALRMAGFDDGQVRAIMGGNALRVLR